MLPSSLPSASTCMQTGPPFQEHQVCLPRPSVGAVLTVTLHCMRTKGTDKNRVYRCPLKARGCWLYRKTHHPARPGHTLADRTQHACLDDWTKAWAAHAAASSSERSGWRESRLSQSGGVPRGGGSEERHACPVLEPQQDRPSNHGSAAIGELRAGCKHACVPVWSDGGRTRQLNPCSFVGLWGLSLFTTEQQTRT